MVYFKGNILVVLLMTNSLVETLLLEIGLTTNEIKIYLTLLKYGPITYNETSQYTSINRTTCYAVAKKLIQQGLAKEDLGQAVVKLVPEPPNALLDKLNKEQTALIKRIELAKRASYELAQFVPQAARPEPRLVYIEEQHITNYLYQRTSKWMQSAKQEDGFVWGFESAQFETDYAEWIQWYWQQPESKGIALRLFSDESTARKQAVSNAPGLADFQLIPDIDFTTDIWIYGVYTIFLSLEKQPRYLIELKEPLLSKNLREFFKALWRATKPHWETASKNRL